MIKIICYLFTAFVFIGCKRVDSESKGSLLKKLEYSKKVGEEYFNQISESEDCAKKLDILLNCGRKENKTSFADLKLDIKEFDIKYKIPLMYCEKELSVNNLKPIVNSCFAVLSKNKVPKVFLIIKKVKNEEINIKETILGGKDFDITFSNHPLDVKNQTELIKAALKEAKNNQVFFIRGRSMYAWVSDKKIKYIDMNLNDFSYSVKTIK